ncbi:MAG TPA: DUF2461 domain-containing protein [Vicinamibacterales bacterium]|jgi:uncharacterized protein (TIGR02453 family)|nr:DUF2461 domain-containing protein [Vicinamibacterales bacterium]
MATFTRFDPKAIAFLKALKRNNDREWFRTRKDEYERLLRGPMLAMVERLAADFRSFAPDLAATPKSVYRIYRDTRFSNDKTPLKTYVSAVFPHKKLAKGVGAGMYFEVGQDWTWVGGGMYAPETRQIQAEREHIAKNHKRLRKILSAPAFSKTIGKLEGAQLQRIPRGFDKEHPAADLLKYRQFLAGTEFPGGLATSAKFYPSVLRVFKTIAPLMAFLNEPLV